MTKRFETNPYTGRQDLCGDDTYTADGGLYTSLIAGETLIAGDVVSFTYNSGNPDTVNKVPAGGDRSVGVVYAGAAAGKPVKIVWGGRAAANYSAAPLKGSVAIVDTTNSGQLIGSNAPDASVTHWRECGHPTGATVSREGRTLYFTMVHFN